MDEFVARQEGQADRYELVGGQIRRPDVGVDRGRRDAGLQGRRTPLRRGSGVAFESFRKLDGRKSVPGLAYILFV